ncbi:hypothetical protein [Candidatus Berkiella aquae]|uniref:RasGEF domain protein n=1 Tax=Candidatus Berkiella aquae TaxID=295108 RepID=A0A0Q9YMR8_9GAMM|nr:hypothetical protein [Candidatus Berkiella aquae]MCS5711058.1 hypothetical protein [Candidatus Berkiella aquae]
MAKPIQKKIAMALIQKKQRATHDFDPSYNTWQTMLHESDIADLIPSLNELQIDIQKQSTSPTQLQELFQTMIHYLKTNYFDNKSNDIALNNYLNSLSHEVESTKNANETFESFFQINKRHISLIYINSQPTLSICFSKLIVNVLSRQIKDSLGILPSQHDNDNICNLLKEFSELCPYLQKKSSQWLEEQSNAYSEKTTTSIADISIDDIKSSLATLMLMPPDEIAALTQSEILGKDHSFRKDVLHYHANSEPAVTLLMPEMLNKTVITKTYRKLHNKLTKELRLQPSEQQHLQQFIIEVIYCRLNNISKPPYYTFKKVQKLCNRQLKVQKQIIKLCQEVERQRYLINTFIEQINTLPVSNEIAILNEFFRKQLQSPLYLKINNTLNRVIKYKRFKSYKMFVIDLLQYIKILITYPILESSLILQLSMEHTSLPIPLSNDDLQRITKAVKKLEKNSSVQAIKRECSYLLHTTVYHKELITNLQQLQSLIETDFKDTITYFLEPVSDPELLHLVKGVNETTSSLTQIQEIIEHDGISEIKVNLLAYQQYLRVLGKARLQAIQDPSNETINQRITGSYQAIELLHERLKVIIDLIDLVENIPEANLMPGIKEQLSNIKVYSTDIKEYFTYISHIAHEFGHLKVDPKDIFLLRITRGDFFRKKDHDILETATIALLFRISPFAIIDGIIAQFNHYDNEQRQESLYFVQNYLKSDTQSLLFSAINPDKSEFYNKLLIFINLAKQNSFQTDKLDSLINAKIVEKQKYFLHMSTMLEDQSLSKDYLIRRINTISQKLKENDFYITKLDEYLSEISKILDNENFTNFNQNEKFQLLETFNSLNEQCDTLPYYQQSFNKLRQKLQTILTSKNNESTKKPDTTINKPIAYSLFELINNSVEEISNEALYDKMLKKFIKNVESEFTKAFSTIDISELRELSWYGDEQRIQQGLNPNAPAIRNYQQLQELATYFIRFAIFYQISSDNTPVPYAKLEQIKPVYYFFQSALIKALELKAITTASILFKAIQTPTIRRLKLSSTEAETVYRQYLSKTKEAQINLAKMFRSNNVLPLLSFIQQKLMFIYKKNYGSQFEHLSNIGRTLVEFEKKKEFIQNKILDGIDYFEQFKSFLSQLGVITSESLQVNVEKANKLLTVRSQDVKRDPTKKVSLNELKTISNLKKYLFQCHSHSVYYQLSDTNSEKAIIEWIHSIIKSDTRFMHFADSIDVIFLIKSINEIQGNSYKRLLPDLTVILTEYHKMIADILKFNNIEKAKPLEHFFGQYLKNMKLREFKDEEASGLFSQNNKIKELLSKIDDQYRTYQNIQAQLEKEKSQQAYSQLLEDVLAGVSKRTLQLPTDNVSQNTGTTKNLLPENEYDIPSAEPEHPDRIGINRTMSFTTSEQKSVLSLFNTDELKKEFIAAFPWALQYDNLDKLDEASFDMTPNLLGTPTLYSTQLQLASMEFVLLAMDALGKIAGFSGDLTIQNFDRISDIINQLQWLTIQLQSDNVNESQLLLQIDENLQEMNFRNNEFFDMQQLYNPPFSVESNPNMNGFCHINEHLVHQLTGIPYDISMLAPNTPDSPYIEKINELFIEDRKS